MGKITAELADGSILEATASVVSVVDDYDYDSLNYDRSTFSYKVNRETRLEADIDSYKVIAPAFKLGQKLETKEDYQKLPVGAHLNPSSSHTAFAPGYPSAYFVKQEDGLFQIVGWREGYAYAADIMAHCARTVRWLPKVETVTIPFKEYDLLKAELVDVHEEKDTLRERVKGLVAQLNSTMYELSNLREAINCAKYELDLVA